MHKTTQCLEGKNEIQCVEVLKISRSKCGSVMVNTSEIKDMKMEKGHWNQQEESLWGL